MRDMTAAPQEDIFSSLTEGLAPKDAFTRVWLTQVVLRMRRELSWLWRKHEPIDWLAESLERHSTAAQRRKFFAEDAAARYLDEQIRETKTFLRDDNAARGSFGWLVNELDLSGAETFVVALALAAARDAALGNLFSTLAGDPRRQSPTLGLAQWLWDEPQAFAPMMSPAHPLFARGILRRTDAANDWSALLSMPALVARCLEDFARDPLPELNRITGGGKLQSVPKACGEHAVELELLASRMADSPGELQIVPVAVAFAQGSLDARRAAPALEKIAELTGRDIYAISPNVAISAAVLENAGTYCWLNGADLLIPSYELQHDAAWQNILRPYPIYVFVAAPEEGGPSLRNALPPLKIPGLSYMERRLVWEREIRRHNLEVNESAVRECAYRFRMDAAAIGDIAAILSRSPYPLTPDRLLAACQQQIRVMVGSQATLLTPRFERRELVLDAERSGQFDQLLSAMRSLSRVHADWGTGRVWGDAGISVLFAGPPGTGKTMAAEVLGAELRLPLYHVDLSQVVNKYIGETEKNLRKLFDAAEQADIVLFFDEADSLFGQRMQARSSNDRFANMEISYLLERMDRFRGLAILATNRKKDLDEAFLRRLRYVIEFPLPAEPERLAIWKQCIPPQVAAEGIDFAFLAHEFALPGGNVRSIVLNACLQSASSQQRPALQMHTLMDAVEREYEKLGRPLSREQKTQWQLYTSGSGRETSAASTTRSGVVL
jgi:hypothetical protein